MEAPCLEWFQKFVSKTNPADDKNLCPWAMRSLLIEDGNRLILIDNGIGDKQDDKFLRHYYLHGDVSLENSLNKYGFTPDDITDVFLTHLHFDHCGGSVKWKKDEVDLKWLLKMQSIGVIKNIGSGQHNQIIEKKHLF